MHRRSFLKEAGLLLGGTPMLQGHSSLEPHVDKLDSWPAVRNQFLLDRGYIHMSLLLLSSHPKVVRDEIERHRKLFDQNPAEHWENNFITIEKEMCKAAASYMNVAPEEVALTDSTSMGLGLLYNGFRLKPGEEVLTSTHDHYATEKSLEFATEKNGASIKRIDLYKNAAGTSVDEILNGINKAIRPETRLVALTWVHSGTGVKLPVKQIGALIQQKNQARESADRIYFAIDGVHGFGVENIDLKEMGCDFFAAGAHKWLHGPRGTGILWAKKDAWPMIIPTIPSFTGVAYYMWLGKVPEGPMSFTDYCTAGGFHSFEHRWSLHKAFEFHQKIGKDKIEKRIHQLNSRLKSGLKENKHIRMITPESSALSSGITCFEVNGVHPDEVVKKLYAKKIISGSSPYRVSYVRLTPGILNNEDEVQSCVRALEMI